MRRIITISLFLLGCIPSLISQSGAVFHSEYFTLSFGDTKYEKYSSIFINWEKGVFIVEIEGEDRMFFVIENQTKKFEDGYIKVTYTFIDDPNPIITYHSPDSRKMIILIQDVVLVGRIMHITW